MALRGGRGALVSPARLLPQPCAWCSGEVRSTRVDARYCSRVCRQAAHRASIERASSSDGRSLRLAYADPPYPGLARRYYEAHPDYAGEVDHRSLLEKLSRFDGWALSTSARALPDVLALAGELGLEELRVASWIRGPRPHRTAPLLAGWEPVCYRPARPPERQVVDVLVGPVPRPRPTLPGSVVGMKPPVFCSWVFGLLGARLGDELADLFPGSGIVGRSWELYQGRDPSRVAGAQLELLDPRWMATAAGEASRLQVPVAARPRDASRGNR